jgi:hypothetical protein
MTTIQLTPEQIAFFHREGYLTIPAITTAEEVSQLCQIYDRLFSEKVGRKSGDHLDLTSVDDDNGKGRKEGIRQRRKFNGFIWVSGWP